MNIIRNRRRFADTMKNSAPYLAVAVVLIISSSSWISNIHAAAPPASGDSYLYNTEDASPVLEHGFSGYDFTKSTSPKVVEFYDPKCGACQAFKSNYIEVAKKVQADKPNVEFYGVSCEAYQSLCDSYGTPTVPKIFAFPGAVESTEGIQVPKGSGTIYFLSARLVKALRTPEEIVLDVEKLGGLETPKRRLREQYSPDEDDGVASEDGDGEASSEDEEDGDNDGASEDYQDATRELSGDEDAASADQDEDESEDQDEDEISQNEDESEDDGDRPSVEDTIQSEESQDREESSDNQLSRGRHDAAAVAELKEKYTAQDTRDNKVSGNKLSAKENTNLSEGSQNRQDESEEQGQQQPAKNSIMEKVLREKREREQQSDAHQQPARAPDDMQQISDAEMNTIRHFETIDAKVGKEKGHHYQKWKEERNVVMGRKSNIESTQNQVERPNFPSSRQSAGGDPSQNIVTTQNQVARPREDPRHIESTQKQTAPRKFPNSRQSVEGDARQNIESKQNQIERPNFPSSRLSVKEDPRQNIESTQNQVERPNFPSSRQSVGGDPRQNIESTQNQIAPRNFPNSRQSVEGDPRQKEATSEDPQYAKSPDGVPPNKPTFSNDRPHSGPISIAGMKEQAEKHSDPPPPPRQHLPVGGDIFVPHPFNQDPVRAKKFQEYVAKRKEMLERKEKMKHPFKTILGNAETKEENDMTFVHKKKSPMNNYKAQYKKTGTPRQGKVPDLRPEAQHKTVGEKVLKKIPIVKRAFKRSQGEETLNDAALSFTRGLLMGLFKSNEPLTYKKKAALLDWLDLLSVSLPPEIGLHELIDNLRYNIDSISQRRENLLLIITEHPLPDHMWSYSCTKGAPSGGFFCGFWKLLHVMSIGFAEQAGGLALQESSPSIRVFSAKEAGDVVREYMALLFNCDKCSKRFVAQYDDCSFQRCHRLSDETVNLPAETWQEFPLWLWQVHNDISRHKSNQAHKKLEKTGSHAQAKLWERDMKAVYPHLDQCISCVTSDGTWNLNAVYNHLEKEYWTFGHEVDPKLDKFLEHTSIERSNLSFGAYTLISLIMLLALVIKKRRIRATTGWHKKVDASSVDRFPEKHRDS